MKCCKCKVDLIGACMICKVCWDEWPKGVGFDDYCKRPVIETSVAKTCEGGLNPSGRSMEVV